MTVLPRWLRILLGCLIVSVALSGFATTGVIVWEVAELRNRSEELSDRVEVLVERSEERSERTREAMEDVIREIRQPEQEGGDRDTREETFRRIRELCEVHEGCEP